MQTGNDRASPFLENFPPNRRILLIHLFPKRKALRLGEEVDF
jgi:hypothetical protein